EGEEEEQDRALAPMAQRGRSNGGRDHEEVDVEPARDEVPDQVPSGSEAPREVGDDVERDADGRLRIETADRGAEKSRDGADDREPELEPARGEKARTRRVELHAP